jgi:hypothetical protein
MDRYALAQVTNWTPQLSPPPDSPLFRWRVLAAEVRPLAHGDFRFNSQTADPISTTLASSFETPRQSAAPRDEVLTLMVRSAPSRVSNHEATTSPTAFSIKL